MKYVYIDLDEELFEVTWCLQIITSQFLYNDPLFFLLELIVDLSTKKYPWFHCWPSSPKFGEKEIASAFYDQSRLSRKRRKGHLFDLQLWENKIIECIQCYIYFAYSHSLFGFKNEEIYLKIAIL